MGVRGAEHVARSDRSLMQRVCPVLDSQPPEQRMAGVGDVAGGEDALGGGLEVLVGEQAVVDHDRRVGGQRGSRCRSDPRDDEVAVDHAPVRGAHALHPPVAFERLDPGAEEDFDAVVGVDVAIDRTDLDAEYVLQRHRIRVYHGHLKASLAGRRCHFASDPAGTDHDEVAAPLDPLA